MGTVKMTTDEYNKYIQKIEQLRTELLDAREEIDKLDFTITNVVQLIDDESDRQMNEKDKWAEPVFVRIKDLSKVIDLDWDDCLKNWRAERKKKLQEMEGNNEE